MKKKCIKTTVALLLVVVITLGFAASTVNAWDWPDSDDVEDWWDDTTDDVEDWWDDTKEETKDWYSQAGEEWRKFKEELENDLDSAIEMARDLPYVSESWDLISGEKKRQLCEDYNDPAKVGELERKRALLTEVAITAIKIMPIYDPERRQIRTFSGFATDLVNENPALAGSDLAKDPVRCAVLLLLESDYLRYAKIIQTNDGKWISIEEAMALGYKANEVNTAKSDYLQAKNAYAHGDSGLVEKHLSDFSSKVQAINNRSPFDSSWLLPSAVISIAGIVSMALLIKRKGRKDESEIR